MSAHYCEIRRATEADSVVLASHRVSMFRDMRSVEPSLESELLDSATSHIREAMASGEYVGWLAYPPGEPARIIGGAGVQLRRLLPRPEEDGKGVLTGQEGIVLNVYVEPDFRRRGLARRLMEEILAWVPGTNIVRLVLHASEDGRPLYLSLGFVPTNEMRYTRPLRQALP
jgi:GNAT superfamily N-acetyltransferase